MLAMTAWYCKITNPRDWNRKSEKENVLWFIARITEYVWSYLQMIASCLSNCLTTNRPNRPSACHSFRYFWHPYVTYNRPYLEYGYGEATAPQVPFPSFSTFFMLIHSDADARKTAVERCASFSRYIFFFAKLSSVQHNYQFTKLSFIIIVIIIIVLYFINLEMSGKSQEIVWFIRIFSLFHIFLE